MSRFRNALPTSQRRGFKMLHHLYYYCSTVLILDALQAEGSRPAPGRVPARPRLLTQAAPPRAPPPARPRPHRPGLTPHRGLCSRPARAPAPRGDRPFRLEPINRASGGGARGTRPPIWAPIGRASRRSRSRAPHPPPSFSSTLPSGKNGGWAAAVSNGGREAEGRGAGELGKEGLQGGGG